jgi:O-antigen/teichoic acid export membrane protein
VRSNVSFFPSIFWIFFDKVFLILLSTFSFFIFAIYLEPSELGKGVMFIAIPGLIAGLFSGMIESPLVSKDIIEDGEYSTVLWFSAILSIVLFIFVIVIGYVLLENENDLFLLGIATSTIIFILISRPFLAKLRRDNNFKSIALRAFLGKCIGFIGGVSLAIKGYGELSIVIQFVLQEFVSLCVMAFTMRSIISFSFSSKLLSNTLRMGRYLSISALSNSVMNNGLPLVLGTVSGTESVGLFNFSNRIVALPRDAIFNGINSYALPSFARVQSDIMVLEKKFSDSNRLSSLLVFPVFSGLAITAPLIINTIFGDKWTDSIIYLQYLALIAIVRSLYLFHSSLFLVLKIPNIITKKELFSSIIGLSLVFLFGRDYGPGAGVLATGFYTFTCFLWNISAIKKAISYPTTKFIGDIFPAFCLSITMVFVVYWVENSLFYFDNNIKLIMSILSGIIVYSIGILFFENKRVGPIFRRRCKK